jgi:hypothetical protein
VTLAVASIVASTSLSLIVKKKSVSLPVTCVS